MWDLSRLDWEERIKTGQSLIPDLPDLDLTEGNRAVEIFNRLRLPDVPGKPKLLTAGGDWFRDIVRSLHGSYDVKTGGRHIKEVFLLAAKKQSKALALDTLIATPTGFTTMGEVQVGDEIMAVDGKPTRVMAKSPVFTGRRCYEMRFSTGETVVCDADHLWVTDAHRDRAKLVSRPAGRKTPCPSVKTTAEIAASLHVPSGKLRITNHRTAIATPLDLPEAPLPIHPYVLGAWIGDGSSHAPMITAGVDEVDEMCARLVGFGAAAFVRARYPEKGSATISLAGDKGHTGSRGGPPCPFSRHLRALGIGPSADGLKRIPAIYLRASREQRLELLRGLVDTDGHIGRGGDTLITTIRHDLALDIMELVSSLGWKPNLTQSVARIKGRDCGTAYLVAFTAFADAPISYMERKASKQRPRPSSAARSESRQIVDVREVPSIPTQCIAVESDTKQFLVTRSLIPTHNTTYSAALMLTSLMLNRRPRGEHILIAPTQQITDLAFSQVVGMIEADDYLSRRFHVRDHLKRIEDRTNGATLVVKSFSVDVITGTRPCGVLIDEIHLLSTVADADRVIGQARGGLISQPEGFLVITTTQSERPPAGVFRAELQKARAIRDGRIRGHMMPVLYEMPSDVDWRDPDNWHMVSPNAGLSMTLDRIQPDFEAAVDSSAEELCRWASQHLNVEVGLALRSDRWAGADYWQRQGDSSLTLDDIIDRSDVVTVGVDGGGLDDLLAVAVLGRDKETREWFHWGHCWGHPSVMEQRKSEAARFNDFVNDGHLTIVDRMGDDIEEIADLVEMVAASGKLHQVGLDPAGIGAVIDALAERGVTNVIGVPQGWKLSSSLKTCERKLADSTLHHCNQPIMAWNVSNAKIEPRGNAITVTKAAAGTAKIDALIALLAAAALMSANPPSTGPSDYGSEARPMLIL